MKTTFKKAVALMLSIMMVFSVCSTVFVVSAAVDSNALAEKSLKACDKALELAAKYYDDTYASAYEYAVENGYVEKSVVYIDIAISSVEAAKAEVAAITVVAEYAYVQDALLAEFDSALAALAQIKALVADEKLATADQAYAELVSMLSALGVNLDNIIAYAYEIGYTVDLHINKAYEAYLTTSKLSYVYMVLDVMGDIYAEVMKSAAEVLASVEISEEIDAQLAAELVKLDEFCQEVKKEILTNLKDIDVAEVKATLEILNAKQLELYAALDDLDAAFKGILENGLEASFDAIEAAIDGVAAEVVEIVAVVSPEGAVYVEQFMAEAKLFVEEVLYNTTHADYTVNKDSYYVALGNGEYVGSFIEKIAEKVKSEGVSYKFDEKDYKDLTSDAGIAALTEIIAANVADIAKADLISLGYTFDTAAENTMRIAIELIFKGETDLPTEFDWVELVGAEAAAEVEKVLATLRAELVAQGLDKTIDEIADVNLGKDITLADAAMAAVEYFAYNAVEYAVVMPQAVYAINKINPDAVIMINAMSNPIAGAKISLFGTELAFGDYINYVTDALYLETAAIAAVNKNVVFVPATEVKTTLTDKVITFNTDDLIELAKELGALITDLELNELIYATEEGNAYIAEQMFAALNITVEHSALLGDVNADGKINLLDAVGVVEYYIGNTVLVDVVAADVTGDGIVDLRDAVCIIEFYIGNINEFPAA